jgi:hypothetical protein
MDIDLVLGVFVASGTGYAAGSAYQYRRAKKYFKYFSQRVIESTSGIADSCVELIREYKPEASADEIVQALVAKCNANGMQVVSMTKREAVKAGVFDGTNN